MVMKKLIVISVVFALVAGAAFAEINVGGAVFGRVDVIKGDSAKDIEVDKAANGGKGSTTLTGHEIFSGGEMTRLRLDASGTSDDGTFGGYFRYHGGDDGGWGGSPFGNAWWKPIDQVKFLVGSAGYDGFFNKDGVARWGFYRDAGDVFGNIEGWGYSNSFYGGFTKGGILTITPIDALEINIGIPFFDGGRGEAVYKSTHAQVAYTIDGIGDFAITYAGDYEGRDAKTNTPNWKVTGKDGDKEVDALTALAGLTPRNNIITGSTEYVMLLPSAGKGDVEDYASRFDSRNNSKFFAYFNLSAVENLGLSLGVGFTLPVTDVNEKTGLNVPGTPANPGDPGRTTAVVNPNFGGDPDSLPPGTNVTDPVLPVTPATPASPAVPADPSAGSWTRTQTVKYSPPLAIGLSASYDAGAIGIKARVQAEVAQKLTYEYDYKNTAPGSAAISGSYELKGPFKLSADILPSFALNDSMKVFLSAGLSLQAKYSYDTYGPDSYEADGLPSATAKTVKTTDTVDAKVGWHVFPYFTKSVGWCQGFYAGFKLWSDGSKYLESYNTDKNGSLIYKEDQLSPNYKAIVQWAVPIGVAFQF